MRKFTTTTLFTLLNLTPRLAAQTPSTTDSLLRPTGPTPSWGEPFTVENSATLTMSGASSLPTSEVMDTSSAASSAPTTVASSSEGVTTTMLGSSGMGDTTTSLIAPIQSVVSSRSGSFNSSATAVTTTTTRESSSSSQGLEATGGAVPKGFRKMGWAGALAGAAGVVVL